MQEHRSTPQRRLILRILAASQDHPTAEQVYTRARLENPAIGCGTVYRNLAVLAEEGQILRLPMPSGAVRYDGNPHRHGHFSCTSCGDFFDIALSPELLAPTLPGHRVSACFLLAEGLCPDCLGENN